MTWYRVYASQPAVADLSGKTGVRARAAVLRWLGCRVTVYRLEGDGPAYVRDDELSDPGPESPAWRGGIDE